MHRRLAALASLLLACGCSEPAEPSGADQSCAADCETICNKVYGECRPDAEEIPPCFEACTASHSVAPGPMAACAACISDASCSSLGEGCEACAAFRVEAAGPHPDGANRCDLDRLDAHCESACSSLSNCGASADVVADCYWGCAALPDATSCERCLAAASCDGSQDWPPSSCSSECTRPSPVGYTLTVTLDLPRDPPYLSIRVTDLSGGEFLQSFGASTDGNGNYVVKYHHPLRHGHEYRIDWFFDRNRSGGCDPVDAIGVLLISPVSADVDVVGTNVKDGSLPCVL